VQRVDVVAGRDPPGGLQRLWRGRQA
jgi:hypothetical protein